MRNERKAGVARLRIERGVCMPVMACRSGCVACIQAPPALRTPLAKGQRMKKRIVNREVSSGVANKELEEGNGKRR